MPDELFVYRRHDVDLAGALRGYVGAVGGIPTAFVYTPRYCKFATVTSAGRLSNLVETDGVFAGAYEVRAFCEAAELRWRSEPGKATAAVILAGSRLALEGWEPRTVPDVRPLTGASAEPAEHQYLLWGEATGRHEGGWSQLATSRIGELWVPVPGVPPRAGVVLRAVEYVTRDPDHGNTYVFDERLTGLAPEGVPGA